MFLKLSKFLSWTDFRHNKLNVVKIIQKYFWNVKKNLQSQTFFAKINIFWENIYSFYFQNFIKNHQKLNEI